jgi:putative ABC transport system permease protein
VGASARYVGALFVVEAGVLAALGITLGVLFKYLAQGLLNPWVTERFGVQLPQSMLNGTDWLLLIGVWLAALVIALLPAWRAMRLALIDGLLLRN